MNYSLEKSQAILRSIIESPKDIVIFALDRSYCYLAFNQNHRTTMQAIWGVEIAVGMNMLQVIGRDDDRDKAKRNFDRALNGESFTLTEAYGDERINRRYYEDVYSPIRHDDGSVIGLTLYLTDVTEQRQAQLELQRHREHLEELVAQRTRELETAHAQLLQAQKLEGLGVLAGGIAHDFNNLLAVVLGSVDLAFQRSDSMAALTEQLHHIRAAVVQASLLTDQLLAYSGRGTFLTKALDLSAAVTDVVELLAITLPKSVTLTCELSRTLPAIEADPAQLQQVIMNLIINAAEAITPPAGGSVIVRTSRLRPEPALIARAYLKESLADGEHVCLEVSDDGCGMSAEVQSKMFDPFFSSKLIGRGLGLAAVLGIVRSLRGAVVVDSRVAEGTRFRVLFPPCERPAAPAPTRPTGATAEDFRSDALVLLVDDDAKLREVLTELLQLHGLRVLQAEDGQQACLQFEQRSNEIALVLLDMTMPRFSGLETLRRSQAIRPHVKVILLSGYTEEHVAQNLADRNRLRFLHKPFHLSELIKLLESMLGTG